MDQTPCHPDKSDNVDFNMMAQDTINLDDVVKDEGLSPYEKLWRFLLSITPSILPTPFR